MMNPEVLEATAAVVELSPPVSAGAIAERAAGAVRLMTPTDMLQIAVQRGDGIEVLRGLMDLKDRHDAKLALEAFNEAFAAFKAEAIKIIRTKDITDGPLRGRKHAELSGIVNAVTPALSRHGLSMSWSLTRDEPAWMEVTCTLRHVAGHSESVSMGGAPDTGPGRNAIQARGSAKSYLERYTATAITGLAAQDQDDDGAAAGGDDPVDKARSGWLIQASSAETEEALRVVSRNGAAHFKATKDRYGYGKFAEAVQKRGADLRGGSHA